MSGVTLQESSGADWTILFVRATSCQPPCPSLPCTLETTPNMAGGQAEPAWKAPFSLVSDE